MVNTAQKIRHLHWRAGFGLSPKEWLRKKDYSLQQAVDELFQNAETTLVYSMGYSGISMAESSQKGKADRKTRQQINRREKEARWMNRAFWLEQMANDGWNDLNERMTFFWHGHFACRSPHPQLSMQQLNTLRENALGNFRTLVHAIAKDPAMIRFLNNQQNRKRKPNENFAREVMELFTIGPGHYTEKDIKEAARAFTGWSSNGQGHYVFRQNFHDFGQKTFMGQTGNFNGYDILNIILDKPETATFICRKAYRYFVNEKVHERRVRQLGDLFYQSNYDIKTLMRAIFESDWFYDKENIGTRIKSPIDLLAGMMRTLDVEVKKKQTLAQAQGALGQALFSPPNVAGWEGGKTWIDNSTLVTRLSLPFHFLQNTDNADTMMGGGGRKKPSYAVHFSSLQESLSGYDEKAIFNIMVEHLFQTEIKLKYRDVEPYLNHSSKEQFIQSLCVRLMSLPEYNMC